MARPRKNCTQLIAQRVNFLLSVRVVQNKNTHCSELLKADGFRFDLSGVQYESNIVLCKHILTCIEL
jgi:pullulanase/glycogen debranching enzyme